jgi:hypothetical protein
MKRWLHSNAVWPPAVSVITFAILYGMVEGTVWLIEYSSRYPSRHPAFVIDDDDAQLVNMRRGILIVAACLYALYRIFRFHPVANTAYANWLRNSPWTASKPLPLGPVQLVWQDAVVIGLLCFLAYRSAPQNTFYPLVGFGLTYLIGMTLVLACTRSRMACLILGFLWPALVLPGIKGLPGAGIIAALVVVIAFGYAESLRRFPWKKENANDPAVLRVKRGKSIGETEIDIEGLSEPASATTSNLGWTFAALSPKPWRKPIATSTSLALSALFGWWSYCAMSALDTTPELAPLLAAFGMGSALVRYMVYYSRVVSPYTVWSRLVLGRFIVPGYDQVYVTPLAVIALATVATIVVRHSGSWFRETAACWMTVLWFVLLSGGPTLQKWILTGQHRYRSPARFGSNKGPLRPI